MQFLEYVRKTAIIYLMELKDVFEDQNHILLLCILNIVDDNLKASYKIKMNLFLII